VSKRQGIFLYSAWDSVHVALVLVSFLVPIFSAWFFDALPAAALVLASLIAATCGFLTSKTQHLFAHTPFFPSRTIGSVFGVLISTLNRVPQTAYYYTHVMVHHRQTISYSAFRLRDFLGLGSLLAALRIPIRAFLSAFGTNWAPVVRQAWSQRSLDLPKPPTKEHYESFDDYFTSTVPGLLYWINHQDRRLLRQLVIEMISIVLFPILLLAIDWRFFCFFYVPARCILEEWILSYEEYCEHYGIVDPADPKRDSVSGYGFINLFLFNAGYHQEHHAHPGVHWTMLPTLREEMPPETERRVVPFHPFTGPFVPLRSPDRHVSSNG
jgi:fatty acid desaturase